MDLVIRIKDLDLPEIARDWQEVRAVLSTEKVKRSIIRAINKSHPDLDFDVESRITFDNE